MIKLHIYLFPYKKKKRKINLSDIELPIFHSCACALRVNHFKNTNAIESTV